MLIRLLGYLLGLCLTVFLLALLIPIAPFLLFYRLVKYVRDKLVLPISCDLLWPLPPFTRAFVWLSDQVSVNSITAILDGQPPPPQFLCFHPTPLSPVEVFPWDHEKAPLRNQDDLITYVKEKMNHVPYTLQVKMVTGYDGDARGSLLAIKTHPDSYPLCMARIVAALSQGNVTIEVEPRVFYECNINPTYRFQCIRRAADKVTKMVEMVSFGPFGLLLLLHVKQEKVWRALVADTHQVFTYHRRGSLMNHGNDSETSRLCINSSVQLRPETSCSFNITEIPNVEELQKVERLLRATMPELLTSFLAGALRRYFRSSDPAVLHPPDCMAALSVCTDKSSLCDSSSPCDHLLLPIHLPIGVEGRIPRLWSLQRELSELADRCTPQAMKAFNALTRTLLTREAHGRVQSLFHRHSVINISFMRVQGDIMLDSSLLTRFIPIPPLSLPTRASFVFVQHRDRIHLVSSIDRGLFDRHNDIFKYMQDEQDGMLSHLSFRLKTLTQTCVLPDRLPSEEEYPIPPEAPQNSPSVERVEGGVDQQQQPGPSRARRQSMADLSELLREVQEELDEMNRNPNVEDRDTTIRRLRELECKIEQFHNGIKSELWGNTVWLKQEKDEAMKKVAELLAPYQRRASVSTRKLSRKASKEYATLRRGSREMRREEESREKKEKEKESSEGKKEEEEKEKETEIEEVNEERDGLLREEERREEKEMESEVKVEEVKIEVEKKEEEEKRGGVMETEVKVEVEVEKMEEEEEKKEEVKEDVKIEDKEDDTKEEQKIEKEDEEETNEEVKIEVEKKEKEGDEKEEKEGEKEEEDVEKKGEETVVEKDEKKEELKGEEEEKKSEKDEPTVEEEVVEDEEKKEEKKKEEEEKPSEVQN